MINTYQFSRFIKAFFRRMSKGQLKAPFYLSYFYIYLWLYDLFNSTSFTHSQNAEESGVPKGGTGNFPAHPRIVKMFLQKSGIAYNDNVLDVGSGSGMVLHVADKLGFINLTGIEFSQEAYNQSKRNLRKEIHLIHGDALMHDLSIYDAIFFFSPFRGDLAAQFFEKVPFSIKKIVVVNHDPGVEPVLLNLGFKEKFSYQHFIYKNFNGKVFSR